MGARKVTSDRSHGEWLHFSPVIFPQRRRLHFLSWEMGRILPDHLATGIGELRDRELKMKAL